MASNVQKADISTTSLSNEENVNTILANCLLLEKQREPAWIPRIKVRLAIVGAWDIKPGARILDIGCGQGESAVTLAHMLGPDTAVHAIDPGLPDYGSPYTLSQSWDHISTKTELGRRIHFHSADAAAFFQSPTGRSLAESQSLDGATLCHSLWYFPDGGSVGDVFQTLSRAGVRRVYLAEYAFEASSLDQEPHFLAAKSQALFQAYKVPRPAGRFTLNIRAAPDIGYIKDSCEKAGYSVARQGRLAPGQELLEGHRQAMYTKSDAYIERVKVEGLSKDQEDEILAYVPLIEQAYQKLGAVGKDKSRAMDIWWAELHLKQ